MTNFLSKKLNLINEFYYFKIVFNIVSYFTASFYLIFLYKSTGDFTLLIIDSIIFYIAAWVGFVIASIIVEKLGYVRTFKLSFILQIAAYVFILLNYDRIVEYFVIFTILRSLPRGMFWAVNNIYEMKEFNETTRGSVISTVNSLFFIFGIIFPAITGAVISFSGSYHLTFIIGIAVLAASLVVGWKYNKKPRSQISSTQMLQILRHPQFKSYGISTIINIAFDATIVLTFFITPFLFLKSEFKLGILASFINLFAAFILFIRRKNKISKDIMPGFFGNVLYAIFNFGLVYFWTIEAFIISGLMGMLGSAISDTLKEKMEMRTIDHIMGENKNQLGIEFNLIRETLFFIGRMIGLILFLLLFSYLNNNVDFAFKLIIGAQSIWCLIYYLFLARLQKHTKFHESVDTPTIPTPKPARHLFSNMHH